jgi:AraC-like DNA-binding protein
VGENLLFLILFKIKIIILLLNSSVLGGAYIHKSIIVEAKKRLLMSNNSISTVAYDLGFKYPQYFTRLFKKETGMTPKEFKNSK